MIFDIKRYAIHDGPGIRTAVFLKGCPLKCWWCHNPEGQGSQPQLLFRANRCKAFKACIDACPRGAIRWENGSLTDWETCDQCGKCAAACYPGARELVGRCLSVAELMREIERDVPFYDQSGGGVTFSGGEPMFQCEFLRESLYACKERGIHTIVDTSGHAAWGGFESILPLVDLFLYDLKLMDDTKHLKYTSVSNRLILDNLRKLSSTGAHIIVRIPLIPGVNDDRENIEHSANFLSKLPSLDGVELMPYHEIGVAKYASIGKKYRLESNRMPTREEIEAAEAIIAGFHLPVINHQPGRTK
ncbi:MAG: hypothetical protein A2136_09200 [Chloroflexi bacterium RBG_16_54_11]|nr:MAG: hypothetical protein A2136_09200 [Chloroflexi bacterium RBG_16_54_11]